MHKKKLWSALVLLLVCAVVMVSASYAWLSLSRVPEVTGVRTHIGANGSLEIALLSDTTFADPSLIRTKVGDSAAVQDSVFSNLTWGNVVDLSDDSYGLSEISLYPSRLNVSLGADKPIVGSNILIVPKFGADGRMVEMQTNTLSAAYTEDRQFVYHTASQSYGVRGIGALPVSKMTAQQAALASARSLVRSYRSSAIGACESTWKTNGAALLRLYLDHYIDGKNDYDDTDVAVLRDTAARMQGAVGYVDSALRQGVIGIAASAIKDASTFSTFRKNVENTAIPLSTVLQMLPNALPADFSRWVTMIEEQKVLLRGAIITCDNFSGGQYTWTQIEPLIHDLLDADETYFGDDRLSDATAVQLFNKVTLTDKSGVFSLIADYSGNYFVIFDYVDNVGVEVKTTSTITIPYLTQISTVLDNCEAADGDSSLTDVKLEDLYGYAVDLACRCNADASLLLQTAPALRANESSEYPQTQGGGSYMQFFSEQLDIERLVRMMDALRIGFMDNQNRLLAVAKPNTSNYDSVVGGVQAPIYLYDYSVSASGTVSIGARRSEDNAITSLDESVATVLTMVVWLDGDYVDNSMAAATALGHVTGSLNLQFSTDVELESADIAIK